MDETRCPCMSLLCPELSSLYCCRSSRLIYIPGSCPVKAPDYRHLLGLILGHSIPLPRAIALAILTAGIALVQFPDTTSIFSSKQSILPQSLGLSKRSWSDLTHTAFTVDVVTDDDAHLGDFSYASDRAIGLFYLLLASILSGLAGVWFEKVLKEHKTSVWLRNIQLSLFTLPFGLITLAYMDSKRIWEGGIFQGFTLWTIVIVILQALGGLIVAIVVKIRDMYINSSILTAKCMAVRQLRLTCVYVGRDFGDWSTLLYAHGGNGIIGRDTVYYTKFKIKRI
ncbi:hypothetical protein BSLG_003266 [Batrachochytrium salamandrivorans]|nr:hypothetical protein BSLG_003266 [Batrachochytrium salamandrivorans]